MLHRGIRANIRAVKADAGSERRVGFLELAAERVVLTDGGMGTSLQARGLVEAEFGGHPGCNEALVLSRPDVIAEIHAGFLRAGADLIQSNTFSAMPAELARHGLEADCERINLRAAEIARRAADAAFAADGRPRFVAGSIGPGSRLAALGQVGYDELLRGYRRQIEGLCAGGVDLLQIETVQDLLQAKAAMAAAREVMGHTGLPIYVSVTVERQGTLLTGPDIATAAAVLSALEPDVLGMNCAVGPGPMRPHLEQLCRVWGGLVGVYPNAGIPNRGPDGALVYPASPGDFAAELGRFVREMPIQIAGGCCGTTPEHIRALAAELEGLAPRAPSGKAREPCLASTVAAVSLRQDPPPLLIGERANATGSRAFRRALLDSDLDAACEILVAQGDQGCHAADLSVAYAGQDELGNMEALVARAARECRLPLCIDSDSVEVIERALSLYPGRAIVNSIQLEDGGARAGQVCRLARRFGAALIGLTIDEQGMAMSAERKLAVARRLVDLCIRQHGLRPQDLLLDPLTFSIGSGDPALATAAAETLKAIRRIKQALPGVGCVLGLSNVSFGLVASARRVLNSVFMAEAVEAGLDAAILDPRQIAPLAELDEEALRCARDLIHARGQAPLEAFIRRFAGLDDAPVFRKEAALTPEQAVFEGVVQGRPRWIFAKLDALLAKRSAEDIVAGILVPAMQRVGELFSAGKLQLPFVLKSAEAMRRAVDSLQPHFLSTGELARRKLLLATVRGDVHDIGKNLVDIIVSNNGFEVVNLGTKVPVERIIAAVAKHRPDAVGMSGLLVSSAATMTQNLRAMHAAGLDLPVLVGGAALTRRFVEQELEPAYPAGRIVYCRDAFDGLRAMQALKEGRPLDSRAAEESVAAASAPLGPAAAIEPVAAPRPPFLGSRLLREIDLDLVLSYVDLQVLFRQRWGFKQRMLQKVEYQRILHAEVQPRYEELVRIARAEALFEPRMVYGYFRARADGDRIRILRENDFVDFDFPRRRREPALCVADFVRPDEDAVGFFVVTLGEGAVLRGREVFAKNEYLDYFLLHGLAVELTEGLAEYAHEIMRHGLGIGEDRRLSHAELMRQSYRGCRFAFGYPACPDLAAHEKVFDLLEPARIGVRLTEGHQMLPEYSTAAMVLHHPQARQFNVEREEP